MKKIFIFLALIYSPMLLANLAIPKEFSVKEKWYAASVQFEIESCHEKIGTIYRRQLTQNTFYEFIDTTNNLQAMAKIRFFSYGPIFDILDKDNKVLGYIEEDIFKIFPSFDFYNEGMALIARADMNAWHTKINIYDPITKEPIALLERPFLRKTEEWSAKVMDISFFEQNGIDPRVFILATGLQTDRDHWGKKAKSKSKMVAGLTISNSEDLSPFKQLLWQQISEYSPLFNGVNPKPTDYQFAQQLLEGFIASLDGSEDIFQLVTETSEKLKIAFTSPFLTIEQKAAIFFLLKKFIIDEPSPKTVMSNFY